MIRAVGLSILTGAGLFGCSSEPVATTGAGGAAVGGAGGAGGAPARPYPLPATLDLGGETASVAVGDLDGDGYRDLATLVHDPSTGQARLVVVFGDESGSGSSRWEHVLGVSARGARDSSTSVVVIADIDANGHPDLATASGIAYGDGARGFTWTTFGDEGRQAFQPVAWVDNDGPTLLRGGVQGVVERCSPVGDCVVLPGQPPPCPPDVGCAIGDLGVGDFDGDGRSDVVAAQAGEPTAYVWTGTWTAPVAIDLFWAEDLEVGDIDGDGLDDVVSQQQEGISDFPSYTDVWLGTAGGAPPLTRVQTIYNAENHNDNSALADANGDGCLDLMHIGVDTGMTWLRLGTPSASGCSPFLGAHDPDAMVDVEWTGLPGLQSCIGIQQLDVNADGVDEWVLRAPGSAGEMTAGAILHFQPLPVL